MVSVNASVNILNQKDEVCEETTMDYKYLRELTAGRTLPLSATNADGENVIIEEGREEGVHYYRLETIQKNNWSRINHYYEDGTSTETYEK